MDRAWTSQLRKGLMEFAVLAALAGGEVYGYQLLQRLAAVPALACTESTLYPVLSRLAEERLVAVRQEPSPSGPPRRYYRLVAAGRQRLVEMREQWRQLNLAIEELLSSIGEAP